MTQGAPGNATEAATATPGPFDGLPARCRDCGIAQATERLAVRTDPRSRAMTTDLCRSCADHASRLLAGLGAALADERMEPTPTTPTGRTPPDRGLQAVLTTIDEEAPARPLENNWGASSSEEAYNAATEPPAIGRGDPRPFAHAMKGLTRDLAVIDTEWTEASLETAEIVAIGIVRLRPDGTGFTKLYTVNPERPICPGSSAVHGITDGMVKDLPRFEEYSESIKADIADADLGGYTLRNDVAMLEKSFLQAGIEWDPNGIAMVDALRIWQHAERRRLTDAYERFVGRRHSEIKAHDAVGDAVMTARVLEKLADGRSMVEIDRITDPERVDAAGKFKRDDRGEIVFNLGPHRGDAARKHPDYLQWMQYKDFAPSTLRVVNELLDDLYSREHEDCAPPTPPTTSTEAEAETDTDTMENNEDDDDGIPF